MTPQRARAGGLARIASWLLFAAIALAPLPFGSYEGTAVAFWCIVLGVCLVIAPLRGLGAGRLALAGMAAIVVAAYGLVLHEQLAEHPWLATSAPVWHEAQQASGMPFSPSVSIARNQPWFELGRPLVCMLAIACGFLVGADDGRARQLIKVIAWSGAVYAAYGILAHLFDPAHILWRDKQAYLELVTGTFINRNTAGAYFGSCAVVWSLLLWQRLRREMPRPLVWKAIPGRLFSAAPKKVIIASAMLLLCLVALFMTGSRGATVLSLLALIVAFIAFFRRDLPRWSGLVTALAASGAVALILLQLIGGSVNARFDTQGLADEGRPRDLQGDAAHNRRPSVVRHRAGHLCLRIPGLSKRERLSLGCRGQGSQHLAGNSRRHGDTHCSAHRHRLDCDLCRADARYACPSARPDNSGRGARSRDA